ncbi:MAG: response regulator [Deltaproteobacteria bacterium]|nr:response regulator [Deltaproteobacteria bacterium]
MKPKRESVLVVDDDSEVLTALDAELSEYFDVTSLLSAEQALATLQGQSFSAIISDVRMPGIDGLTLIKECAVRYPDMVRVLLTAFDDEDVQETALGEYGAYKLIKPWGDDLIVTLQNALKQRKSNIELQKSIDLGTAALDVDLRLHFNLSQPELLNAVAAELQRVPEVICQTVVQFDDDGQVVNSWAVGVNEETTAPRLTRKRYSSPEQDGDYLKYTVPVGTWPAPIAAYICRLTKVNEESLRYMDFIGRQAFRTWLIVNQAVNNPDLHRQTVPSLTPISPVDSGLSLWMSRELSTATTVIVSATESIREEAKRFAQNHEDVNELEDIASDLDSAYAGLTKMLEKVKR